MKKISESTWTQQVTLPSVCGAGHQFLAALLDALKRYEWTEREIFGVHLAAEEALVNAIRHGNGSDEHKQVRVSCTLEADRLYLEIVDEGSGFDPEEVPDCTDAHYIHRPRGRGIMLMRKYMSRVEYRDGGHRVIMEKRREISS
jgi:serine/threonine-protein kinase RsbW